MSEERKSTPGPWQVKGRETLDWDDYSLTIGTPAEYIAEVYLGGGDRDEANAQLIAAAPELAEALRQIFDFAEEVSRLQRLNPKTCDLFERVEELLTRVKY